MTAVDPAAAAVTPALAALRTSLADGYGPGASSTHHRALVLTWFGLATNDPRIAADAVFDPDALYTKLGALGIERALAHYVKFLHDPANEIASVRGTDAPTTYAMPASSDDSARMMIVEAVDMMLAKVATGEDHYTNVWGIAKATYEPTLVDTDDDGVEDFYDSPINLTAPVLSASGRDLSVTDGTWTASLGATDFYYAWYLDGVLIDGQTTSTYTAPDTDAGDFTVRVTVVNDYGQTSVLSNAVTLAAA